MNRPTSKTISDIADSASELASDASARIGATVGEAADKIGALFAGSGDGFTDTLIAKAKAVEPRNYVPSRQTVAKGGAGAGLVLAGTAAVAAGAFALYYWRERNQEEARFDLIAQEAGFELRRYQSHLVAETVVKGDRDEALSQGFKRIADYIFAKPGGRADGDDNEKIAMTVPVSTSAEDNRTWTVRFVMPAQYKRKDLPTPAAGVSIAQRAKRHVAVLRFSGKGSDDALVVDKRRELMAWVEERGFKPVGEVEYAFYNAPIVPGFLRRNEVWIAVEPV